MSAPQQHANLEQALSAAQREVQALFKDGTNDHHKYPYTTSESIIDRGRVWLAKHGLALEETAAVVNLESRPPTVHTRYRLSHESGTSKSDYESSWPAIEGKGRPLDKIVAGVRTTALAYALRGVLLIPRSDEIAEVHARDDRDYDPPPREERRPEPSNDTRHEDERRPETRPIDMGDMLRMLRENKLGEEGMREEVRRSGLDEDRRVALGYLIDARHAKTKEAFTAVAADIKNADLPKDLIATISAALKYMWEDLTERIREAS